MPGRMEGEVFLYPGQPPDSLQVLVDGGVRFQAEKLAQVPAVFLEQPQRFSLKEKMQGDAHFRTGLHGGEHEPPLSLYRHDIVLIQLHKVLIADSRVATEQEGLQTVS